MNGGTKYALSFLFYQAIFVGHPNIYYRANKKTTIGDFSFTHKKTTTEVVVFDCPKSNYLFELLSVSEIILKSYKKCPKRSILYLWTPHPVE